jgi:dihydroxyacetone kinase DhaKLM complex PTS-EIIA-like component DhaM
MTTPPACEFTKVALKNAESDLAIFYLNLGHAALELNLPAEAMNQYIQAKNALGEGSIISIVDVEGAISHLTTLHPNLSKPVIITQREQVHPIKSIFVRVFENTAVRILSLFSAGFLTNVLI